MVIARVDEFIEKLSSLNDENSIKELCNCELDYLREKVELKYQIDCDSKIFDNLRLAIEYKQEIKSFLPIVVIGNASNLRNQLTKYRHSFRFLEINDNNSYPSYDKNGNLIRLHFAFKYLTLHKIELENCRSQNSKRNREDSINLLSFNPIKVINKAKELLNSDSYIDKILGLYLLTGRRHEEILASLTIHDFDADTVIDSNIEDWLLDDVNSIVISGMIKQKDKPYTNEKELIPILCKPELIINAINWLRENKPQPKILAFYQQWLDTGIRPISKDRVSGSKELGLRCKKHFADILPSPNGKIGDINPHNLRSAYIAICKALYDNSEYKFNNLSLDWFIESCLRHKSEKFSSVDAYKDYQLSDNDISLLLTMKDN